MSILVLQAGETYDWRLSVPNMETRDHYFTRLKWRLELSLKTEGEKVLLECLLAMGPPPPVQGIQRHFQLLSSCNLR